MLTKQAAVIETVTMRNKVSPPLSNDAFDKAGALIVSEFIIYCKI